MQRSVSILAASVLAATASAQLSIVIPNGMAAAEGSSSNAFPWGRGGTGILMQAVYDSSHFTLQGITYPILITGLKWRPNTNVALVATTFPTPCSIRCSTSPVDWSAVNTTFANQRGADETLCFQGPVTFPAQAAVVGPTPFGISVPFTTNFLYDPNLGDLNIETDLPIQTGYVGGTPQLDVHATAGQANASRVYWTTGYVGGYPGTVATAITSNHAVVVEVSYVPAAGLYAGLSANVTSGPSPLAVNFTSTSFTSDPGGILTYAWDFDGDSVTDSTAQNPSYVYANCGTYTVSLTVTDATHPPSTQTRTAYISTDNVVPSFTIAPIGPATYQFTDTSVPTPTSWAWDFDGDSVIDSTAQNPVWVYPNPCVAAAVTLTVSRLCKGPFSSTQALVGNVTSQSTVFTGGNGLSGVGSGNTFDIQVTNPAGINIYAITMAPYMATPVLGTPLGCSVWITDAPGGYLANHTNAAVWRQVATGIGTFAGGTFTAPVPVNMVLNKPIYVPPGTFGMAVHMTAGSGVAYTNVTAPFTYPGTDVNITCGNGKGTPFAAAANAGRAWNGTLHYSLPSNCGLAGYGFFGAGCTGTLGITHVVNTTQPRIGGTLSTNLDNLQFGIAVMILGVSNTLSGGAIPLPLDLGLLGAPGCPLRVSLDVTETVVGVGNTATWSFSIPNLPGLLGFQLYSQAASLDTLNTFGFVTSDAYAWLVGN